MKKTLCVLAVLVISGCATSAQPSFDRSDMIGYKTDCGQARPQVDYLQGRIDAYHAHFRNNTITLEDRRYYGRLKNYIWSLRSSCSALQR